MKLSVKSAVISALLVLGVSNIANAAVYRWSFNYNEGATGVFAFLDFDTVTSDFRIDDNGGQYAGFAATSFASQAGVNGISIDFGTTIPTLDASETTSLNGSGVVNYGNTVLGTALTATAQPALLAGYNYGYATDSNSPGNEINDGESTMFNLGAIDFSTINGIALRYNSSNGGLNSSGVWVVGQFVNSGQPVPEAQSYAMFLAGLGLIGFVSRRRKV